MKIWWTRLDRYGRITLPAELRVAFGLRTGSRLKIQVKNGAILMLPLHRPKSASRPEAPPAQKGS